MLIDWFTVGAQALNFLVLVWLMKRYLYQPILDALDQREARIAAQLAGATAKEAEAGRALDEYRRKNEEIAAHRASLFKQAADDAAGERERLLREARSAAERLRAKHREALQNQADDLEQALRRGAQHEVFAIARRVLADLATTSLEAEMGRAFAQRLRELDQDARRQLAEAVATGADVTTVRSAFELPSEQRAAIRNAINEALSADVPIRFEIAPDVVCGIELTRNGRRVAWSISDYLESLEKVVGEVLADEPAAEATGERRAAEPQSIGEHGG